MLWCMRTTVRLDDRLFRRVKLRAAEERRSFTALLEDALREMLDNRERRRRHERTPLPTFRGRGLQPGVDLDDAAALLDLMEAADDPA